MCVPMAKKKLIENVFFFAVLLATAYLVWQLFSPFFGSIVLAAIIVVICYPYHERVVMRRLSKNKTVGALISMLLVVAVIMLPLLLVSTFLLREAMSVYTLVNTSSHSTFFDSLTTFESTVQKVFPEFSLEIGSVVENAANFFATHLLAIFAGTASTFFFLIITLITLFYFFRDGREIVAYATRLSPLGDTDDSQILKRIAVAIRSVTSGTLLIALIQGVLTTIGLALFGFDRAILWGCVAAISALVPGVGTAVVFIPAVAYLIFTGSYLLAGGLAVWAIFAVGLIDNVLGPYLMSRGNVLHPFATLLSVLGGIAFFGPIGFVLGPVITSLFVVLTELYASYLKT